MRKRRVGTQRMCLTRWARNMQTRASQLGVQHSGHRGVCSLRKANRAAGCPRGGGAGAGRVVAEGSYEQEAAVVEEDEEMEREHERGVAKRPDLNELDVPEWAELALDKVEWRKLLHAAAHRPLEMETASRRQSATTRA